MLKLITLIINYISQKINEIRLNVRIKHNNSLEKTFHQFYTIFIIAINGFLLIQNWLWIGFHTRVKLGFLHRSPSSYAKIDMLNLNYVCFQIGTIKLFIYLACGWKYKN